MIFFAIGIVTVFFLVLFGYIGFVIWWVNLVNSWNIRNEFLEFITMMLPAIVWTLTVISVGVYFISVG